MEDKARVDGQRFSLLHQLEHILESDPLIDEVGYVHPTQLEVLNEEAAVDALHPGELKFWSKDHKLGISTEILFQLYKQAKQAFFDARTLYKMRSNLRSDKGDESSLDHCSLSDNTLENDVLKHSRALLLLSSDFATAWNSRKLIVLKKDILSLYMDEFHLSELILSYSPKSDQAWSHRRWLIKIIAGEVSDLQQIVRRESELVERIAERSKMNYRAWNHRCWLVQYMTGEQVRYELKKSKTWAGLHVADSSCFHYRKSLMTRILEDFGRQNACASDSCGAEVHEIWKEELVWDEVLLKRYIGREALWLYRRFLSLCWWRHFTNFPATIFCESKHTAKTDEDSDIFLEKELSLVNSCLDIPDNDFDDFQAQAIHSSTYILWLAKQLPRSQVIKLKDKLRLTEMKVLLDTFCPKRSSIIDWLEEE